MAVKKTKCFYCNRKINADVRKCPYCGKNQNGNGGFILIIVTVVLLIGINYAVGNPASLPDFGLGKSEEAENGYSDILSEIPEMKELQKIVDLSVPEPEKQGLKEKFLSLFKTDQTGTEVAVPQVNSANEIGKEDGFFSSLFSDFGKSREQRKQEKALIEFYESMGFTKAQAKDLLKTPENMAASQVTRDFYKAMGFSDEEFEELANMSPEDLLNGNISEEALTQVIDSSMEMTNALFNEALSEENIKEFSKAMRGNIARVGMETFSYTPGETIPVSSHLEWGLVSVENAGYSLSASDPSVGPIESETGYVKVRYLLKNSGNSSYQPDPFGSGEGVPWLTEDLGDSVFIVFFNSSLVKPGEISPDSADAVLASGEEKMYTVFYELPPYHSESYRLELGDTHITFIL